MSETTKGPWIAEGSRIVSEGARNLTIARVGVAADGDYSDANARLIASAPELEEALAILQRALQDRCYTSDLMTDDEAAALERARAALAKARGEA